MPPAKGTMAQWPNSETPQNQTGSVHGGAGILAECTAENIGLAEMAPSTARLLSEPTSQRFLANKAPDFFHGHLA